MSRAIPTIRSISANPPANPKLKRSSAKKMTCNNCGGKMERSDTDYHATVCRGCGMRHDWSCVREPQP